MDEEKAGLHNLKAQQIAETLKLASDGLVVGLAHDEGAPEDVPIEVRVRPAQSDDLDALGTLRLRGGDGHQVEVDEVTHRVAGQVEPSIYHKNLQPVVYVTADMAGAAESPVYAILKLAKALHSLRLPDGAQIKQYTTHQPFTTERLLDEMGASGTSPTRSSAISGSPSPRCGADLRVGRRWFASFKTPW